MAFLEMCDALLVNIASNAKCNQKDNHKNPKGTKKIAVNDGQFNFQPLNYDVRSVWSFITAIHFL